MAKQVEMSQSRLSRELDKIDGVVKSEIRMLSADRQRFQMKHRNLKSPRLSAAATVSKAKDVHMYETHTPGFCYNRVGAIKGETSGCVEKSPEEREAEIYQTVRSWIFTDGLVDLDKIVCLHLLTLHEDAFDECDIYLSNSTHISSQKELENFMAKESRAVERSKAERLFELPCYVLKIQHDETKCCKKLNAEDKALKEFENRYNEFVQKNKDIGRILNADQRVKGPNPLGKIPFISPDLYNSLVEDPAENYDRPSSTATTRSGITSRRSTLTRPERNSPTLMDRENTVTRLDMDSYTRKGNYYQQPNTTTFLKEIEAKAMANRISKQYVYIRLTDKLPKIPHGKYAFRIASICVNEELKKVVRTIIDVLETVNVDKANLLLDTLRSAQEIDAILKKPEIKNFLSSLKNSTIISSNCNFTSAVALVLESTCNNAQEIFQDQIIAKTIQVNPDLGINDFLDKVRKDLIAHTKLYRKEEDNASEFETSITTFDPSDKYKKNVSCPSDDSQITKTDCTSKLGEPKKSNSSRISSAISTTSRRISDKSQSGKSILKHRTLRLDSINNSDEERFSDPEQVILNRMTRAQRVLISQMCASLKNKEINNKGVSKQKIPLDVLLAAVLSRESIKTLTKGTVYAQADESDESVNEKLVVHENLSAAVLSQIRQDIAETETRLKLNSFMMNKVK